jgi:hypothetical protein
MEKENPEFYRVLGSVAGAVLPLLYVRPINIRDAIARFTFAGIVGYAFYFIALDFFGWPETPRRIMAGAILAGAVSWFIAGGLIVRVVKQVQSAKAFPDEPSSP